MDTFSDDGRSFDRSKIEAARKELHLAVPSVFRSGSKKILAEDCASYDSTTHKTKMLIRLLRLKCDRHSLSKDPQTTAYHQYYDEGKKIKALETTSKCLSIVLKMPVSRQAYIGSQVFDVRGYSTKHHTCRRKSELKMKRYLVCRAQKSQDCHTFITSLCRMCRCLIWPCFMNFFYQ